MKTQETRWASQVKRGPKKPADHPANGVLIPRRYTLCCAIVPENRPHPEQGFRACLGIILLVKILWPGARGGGRSGALEIGARTYDSVKSILVNNLDRQAAAKRGPESPAVMGDESEPWAASIGIGGATSSESADTLLRRHAAILGVLA